MKQKNPYPKGTLAFAAWVIARLGGWTAYYGKPGPKIMRLGLEAFRRIKYGTTLKLQKYVNRIAGHRGEHEANR